jgi:hypothetical protein
MNPTLARDYIGRRSGRGGAGHGDSRSASRDAAVKLWPAGLFGALRLTPAGTPRGAFTPLHGVVRNDADERPGPKENTHFAWSCGKV